MKQAGHVFPEIWLSLIAVVVFFPMMYLLGQQKSFDLWRFSILFTLIIVVVYGYAFIDMRRRLKYPRALKTSN